MSRTNYLLGYLIGLNLICIAMPTLSQQNAQIKLTKELVILNSNEDQLSYKIGNTILAEGKLLNGLKTEIWKAFYANGTPRATASYLKGKLNGNYVTYYENGQKMCSSYFLNDLPSDAWASFYENGTKQGEIKWLEN